MSIRIFCSTDKNHSFSKIARAATKKDRTHCGLHRVESNQTYEQRLKCGYYSWSDYTKPDIEVDEWQLLGVSEERVVRAFIALRWNFDDQRYNVGQLLAFLPYLLWRKIGVDKDIRISKLLVCSELVWHFIDNLGGNHQRVLRAELPDKDEVTPGDIKEFCNRRNRLFKKVRRR